MESSIAKTTAIGDYLEDYPLQRILAENLPINLILSCMVQKDTM